MITYTLATAISLLTLLITLLVLWYCKGSRDVSVNQFVHLEKDIRNLAEYYEKVVSLLSSQRDDLSRISDQSSGLAVAIERIEQRLGCVVRDLGPIKRHTADAESHVRLVRNHQQTINKQWEAHLESVQKAIAAAIPFMDSSRPLTPESIVQAFKEMQNATEDSIEEGLNKLNDFVSGEDIR